VSEQPSTDRAAKLERLRELAKQLDADLRAARAKKAKRSLSAFVQQAIAAGVIEGIRRVEWGPHLEQLCFETQMQLEAWLVANGFGDARMIARQRVAWERTGATWEDGDPEPWLRYVLVQNQVDNLPPGTLKSTIVMVCACAWIWLWCSTFSFGAVSGIDSNVTRDSNACRELVTSPWYRETFQIGWNTRDLSAEEQAAALEAEERDDERADIKVRHDRNSVSEWATTAGGKRISRTLTRGLTGMHVDGVFLDDADDADRVWSEPERIRTQNRWTRACENRVNDEHKSIRKEMQQVVHVEGLSAYLLSIARWTPQNPKGWSQFCLAAEYGFGPADAPLETPWGTKDWRTKKGEVLHRRLSPGVLADKRSKIGPLAYEAQYNQNAQAITNGVFKRDSARFFVFPGTVLSSLRRRPDGFPSRTESPPIVVKLTDLRMITLSVDAANSVDPNPASKKTSAVGLVVAGEVPYSEERCVMHDATRVLGPSATYQAIYTLIAEWPLDRILVEVKALGAGVIDQIRQAIRRGWYVNEKGEQVLLRGPDGKPTRAVVEEYDPGKESKDQRNIALVPPWEQGHILFLDGANWLYPQVDENRKIVDEGMLGEICSWPNSRRRDRMDALGQSIASRRGAGMDVRDRIKVWSL
jgi:hypothetical protein